MDHSGSQSPARSAQVHAHKSRPKLADLFWLKPVYIWSCGARIWQRAGLIALTQLLTCLLMREAVALFNSEKHTDGEIVQFVFVQQRDVLFAHVQNSKVHYFLKHRPSCLKVFGLNY